MKPRREKVEVTLRVPNMHCEGCVRTMKEALVHNIGETELEAELEHQVVTAIFTNEETTLEGVEEILTEAGFEPSEIIKHEARIGNRD
ncbi:hypothetical protein GWO43_17315 [candidate division KSB1 bacterium]|nr:hypothetical protein [candidate division KSB1 bacterium]NIS25730.1 hypothetical protein [candidate division KSB1 bacterium]NIT72597.1 hypothetical protein [candidate division KSB1 bacterium]NIU26411.1 hypothetical protein [candidate division KSB1 bacterium]NIU89312.1 hypothetical protein [candidate division KSB1 bacterium]